MDSVKTITYCKVGPLEIKLDLHIPPGLTEGSYPAVVYFHGGGLVTANREGLMFQQWLLHSLAASKTLFISADYRLLHPSTGFSIISDVKALFTHIASPSFSTTNLPTGITLDTTRLAVSGESAGGYPATAAAIYASPKPRCVLLQYPAGGNILSDHYLAPKPDGTAPAPDGTTANVPRVAVGQWLDGPQEELADDLVGFLSGKPEAGGGERTALLLYWLGQGLMVDAILGREGVSETIRAAGSSLEEREKAVPEELRDACLQLKIDGTFPPTFAFHGGADEFFLPEESKVTHEKLQKCGVRSELHIVEGGGHGLVDVKVKPSMALVEGSKEVQEKAVEWLASGLK